VIISVGHNRVTPRGAAPLWVEPLGFLASSFAVTGLLVISAWRIATPLGAPSYWTWLLTGLQVLALWAAGTKRPWGWLLGAAVQPPWIAYALLTGQLGFIPGCAVSGVVQTYSFWRARSRVGPGRLTNFGVRTTEIDSKPAEVTV
jgi:hypothetical protein